MDEALSPLGALPAEMNFEHKNLLMHVVFKFMASCKRKISIGFTISVEVWAPLNGRPPLRGASYKLLRNITY